MPKTGERAWRRVLPRSVLGITALMLAASMGAAASGAALFAYYNYRLAKNERGVAKFAAGFDKRFKEAVDAIAAERDDATAQIRRGIAPIQELAGGETMGGLTKKVAPSLWFVRTMDEAGQPSVGSAFTVAGDSRQTFLVTSYTTVRAATRQPAPAVTVRQGDEELPAAVWTWQEDRDLALLRIDKGDLPRLPWVNRDPPVKTGDRIFALSGLGSSGGAIAPGFVADVSAASVQHGAPIGPQFQGGPLINIKGEVVGVASRSYAPLGFAGDGVFFAVPINMVCDKVLKCPGGTPGASAAGQRR